MGLLIAFLELAFTVIPALEPVFIRETRQAWRDRIAWGDFYDRLKRPHPELGFSMTSDFSDTLATSEYVMHVRTSALTANMAIRDDVKSAEVWFIGDSFGYGAGVNKRDRVSEVFEALTGKTAMNLSVFSTGVLQQRIILERALAIGTPKYLVHLLFLNDPMDDALFTQNGARLPPQGIRRPSRAARARMYLRQHSSFYALYSLVKNRYRHEAIPRLAHEHRGRTVMIPLTAVSFVDAENPLIKEGLEITGRGIRDIRDACAARGIAYLPVLIPSMEMMFLPDMKDRETEWAKYRAFYEMFKTRISESTPCLDPYDALREEVMSGDEPVYFGVDGHLTAAGHRILAEFLVDKLNAIPAQ
ncbi:hypothetical protein HY522_11710 [bacterium]|nr:hypothetical protein [bacterium]